MAKHKDKPSWDNCCSCALILEKQIKELEFIIRGLVGVKDKHKSKPHPMDRPNKIGKVKNLIEDECSHENVEHQPAEYDTNVSEAYTCKDCGEDLDPPPEPDCSLLAKEQNI